MKSLLPVMSVLLAFGVAHADEQRAGDLTIRYNALSAAALPVESARAYGLEHEAHQGVLNISVARNDNDASVQATVTGKAQTLTGIAVPITFREVSEGGSVSYLGSFRIPSNGTLRFMLKVHPREGSTENVDFVQDFQGL